MLGKLMSIASEYELHSPPAIYTDFYFQNAASRFQRTCQMLEKPRTS